MERRDAVEIQFQLSQADGWPPTPVEALWCTPDQADRYVVANVPIHVIGVSRGDTVRATRDDGPLQFTEVLTRGGHSTLRVIVADPEATEETAETLRSFGVTVQHTYIEQLLTVDAAPELDISPLLAWLLEADAREEVDWEEGHLAEGHALSH